MSNRPWFAVPCPHEADPSIAITERMPDYHPLSRNEIAAIMAFAATSTDGQQVARAQVRLGQAIPGAMCPHEDAGEYLRRSVQLGNFFVENCDQGRDQAIVDEIMLIIEGKGAA